MKHLILVYSLHGSTLKTAEKIAQGIREGGSSADIFKITSGEIPSLKPYDVILFGMPVYYFAVPIVMEKFIATLPRLHEKRIYAFFTYGTYHFQASDHLRRILRKKDAEVEGWFYCRGADFYYHYNTRGILPSAGHPDESELNDATTFGKNIAKRTNLADYPMKSTPPKVLYRAEMLLTNKFMVTTIFQHLFRLDRKKCIRCGLCIKSCPTQNIERDANRYPMWDSKCTMCLKCEGCCPVEAITSVAGWKFLSPIVDANVKAILRDNDIQTQRIVYHHGKMQENVKK
jgi:ferredoxin/flavodoxin